jgi:hypothetical protein
VKLPRLNDLQSSLMNSALSHFEQGASYLDRAKSHVRSAQVEFATTVALLGQLKREVPALARLGRRLVQKAQLLQQLEGKKGARGKQPQVASPSDTMKKRKPR